MSKAPIEHFRQTHNAAVVLMNETQAFGVLGNGGCGDLTGGMWDWTLIEVNSHNTRFNKWAMSNVHNRHKALCY